MAFFDQIGSKITSMGNQIAGKTQGSIESARLENEISSIEQNIHAKYTQLGYMFYKFNREKGDEPDYETVMKEIDALSDEIKEKKEKIEEIHSRTVCPICGTYITAGTKFCPNCGTNVEDVSGQMNASAIGYCPECGAPITDRSSKFCLACGAKLSEFQEPVSVETDSEDNK